MRCSAAIGDHERDSAAVVGMGGALPVAIKHLDPIIGLDIHIVQPPGPVPPVPVPHPYVGVVMGASDYIPKIGATVMVNGLRRAKAGTSGLAIPPHLPIGGIFPKPP